MIKGHKLSTWASVVALGAWLCMGEFAVLGWINQNQALVGGATFVALYILAHVIDFFIARLKKAD